MHDQQQRLRQLRSRTTHLEAALQHAQREGLCGLSGEPQPEVGVRAVDLLQDLLQRLQPLGEQVAILRARGQGRVCACACSRCVFLQGRCAASKTMHTVVHSPQLRCVAVHGPTTCTGPLPLAFLLCPRTDLQHNPQPTRHAHLDELCGLGAHALPQRHVLELGAWLEAHVLSQLEYVKRGVRACMGVSMCACVCVCVRVPVRAFV